MDKAWLPFLLHFLVLLDPIPFVVFLRFRILNHRGTSPAGRAELSCRMAGCTSSHEVIGQTMIKFVRLYCNVVQVKGLPI